MALTTDEALILSGNARFRNLHAGKRCFVIGNGSSLANQELQPLKNELTFVMNAFWKHQIVEQWQPSYYFFADPALFDGSNVIRSFFSSLQSRIHATTYFVPIYAEHVVREQSLLPASKTNYVKFTERLSLKLRSEIDFAVDVPSVQSTSQMAIMAAIYMGCSPIYLLGLDHDWLSHRGRDKHFYQGSTVEGDPNETKDLSHFGYKSEMESMLTLWNGYESLLAIAERQNIRIFNATEGGFLDVFERANFEAVIG